MYISSPILRYGLNYECILNFLSYIRLQIESEDAFYEIMVNSEKQVQVYWYDLPFFLTGFCRKYVR